MKPDCNRLKRWQGRHRTRCCYQRGSQPHASPRSTFLPTSPSSVRRTPWPSTPSFPIHHDVLQFPHVPACCHGGCPTAPIRTPPRSDGDMYLTDTDEAGYTGNGDAAHGKPAELRAGHPVFRIFCEMYSVDRKLRILTTKHHLQGRAPRRAPLVALSGIAVPLSTTVGGALFRRPGRAPAEEKHGAADKRG